MKPPSKLTQRDRLVEAAKADGYGEGLYVGLVKGVLVGIMLHKTLQSSTLKDAMDILTPSDLKALSQNAATIFTTLET